MDRTSKGLCNSSVMRKRAREVTFPASRSSSETSLADSTFTAGKPIYVHESDGTLHPRASVFSPLPCRESLGTGCHEVAEVVADQPSASIAITDLFDRVLFVVYSANANARNYRLSKNILWLERRRPRCARKVQASLLGEGHHPESGVSLGDGNQERATAIALC